MPLSLKSFVASAINLAKSSYISSFKLFNFPFDVTVPSLFTVPPPLVQPVLVIKYGEEFENPSKYKSGFAFSAAFAMFNWFWSFVMSYVMLSTSLPSLDNL